jgi:hypothetical protein
MKNRVMKRKVMLSEKDISRIIRKVISEQESGSVNRYGDKGLKPLKDLSNESYASQFGDDISLSKISNGQYGLSVKGKDGIRYYGIIDISKSNMTPDEINRAIDA